MKRLYGDTLRKDAGLTRVLKTVTRKHVLVLDKHVPELAEVAKRLQSVYGEAAVALEDLLARCKCRFVRCVYTHGDILMTCGWVISETQGQGASEGYDQGVQEKAGHAYVYVRVLELFAWVDDTDCLLYRGVQATLD